MAINAAIGGLFISDPLLGFGGSARGMLNLLSTHPPTEARLAELEELAEEEGWDQPPPADNTPGGSCGGSGRGERKPGQTQKKRSSGGLFAKRGKQK